MLFLWTVVAFNLWGAYHPVPGFIHPNQNIVTRAKGAFMAACTATSVTKMAKNIYHTNIHHTNKYRTSRQDESSVGIAVGFPNVTSLSVYRMRAPDDDFRCWEWESGPEQPFIPPSEEASWYLISANAAYALVQYTRRQRGFSSHSQDSKRKTELAHGSKQGTTSSSVDVDNCSSNAETNAPPNSEMETSADLVKEPKGKQVAREPPTMPANSHSEVHPEEMTTVEPKPRPTMPAESHSEGSPEETVAPESKSEEAARKPLIVPTSFCSKAYRLFSYLVRLRPKTEQADPEETTTVEPKEPPTRPETEQVNPEETVASEPISEEVAREPPTTPAESCSDAGPSSSHLTGQRPETEQVNPEETVASEPTSEEVVRASPTTPTASQSELNPEEAATTEPEGGEVAMEPPTKPAESHSEAGPSSSHLAGQQPETEQVNPEETAATEGDANSASSRLRPRKCRPSKARRDRAKRRLAHEAAEAAQLEAEANADAPSDLAPEPKGKEAVRDPPRTLADLPTEADAALEALAEAGTTGHGQMLEGAAETFTPLADSLAEASTTDGPKNKPSQKKRRQLARREAEAALAAQAEAGPS
ncbi:uncharacterized protein LDX57_001047 [Aspergillus melleus]|uniref:uncharacterized protein n=1 Tax=Aspergillus melleus TaxID=138277 RepID=UPI001E8E2902|nr:uncharacterized protein LDX57_001047 [Aspergillus melleus]KAH8423289.1 hypothetical protein LDX57_001047 [Aspergillus melleus]